METTPRPRAAPTLDDAALALPVRGRNLAGATLGALCAADDERPQLLVFLRHFG
ncbi:MAG: hypothetical protein R3F49_16705 [Planctomycetota bacterium]